MRETLLASIALGCALLLTSIQPAFAVRPSGATTQKSIGVSPRIVQMYRDQLQLCLDALDDAIAICDVNNDGVYNSTDDQLATAQQAWACINALSDAATVCSAALPASAQ